MFTMIMKLLEPTKQELWNDIVASANGHIFQTTHWMEVAELLGSKAIPMMMDDNAILMMYQNPILSMKRFGICLNSLTTTRGPIFRNNLFDNKVFFKFVEEIEDYARRNHVVLCRLAPHRLLGDYQTNDLLRSFGFNRVSDPTKTTFHTQTFIVDLRSSLDLILSRMEKRTRWSIRKAEKSNVKVEYRSDQLGVKIFYELYRKTVPTPSPPEFFATVMQVLGSKGLAKVFLAKIGTEYATSAFLLVFGSTIFYAWGGSNPSCNRFGAGEFLHWKAMQWGKENGHQFNDLHGAVEEESTASKKKPDATLFKRGFGGTSVKYVGEYRKVYPRFLPYCGLNVIRQSGSLIYGARRRWRRFLFCAQS
jgi:lipid II:glycine glycyltransferase (peptidoglycan interpeptide bridge formation enzyme)